MDEMVSVYRFDQPIEKQYSYGHGPDSASEDDKYLI